MIALNLIEENYFALYESRLSLEDFEQWIYANEASVSALTGNELYFELMALNYRSTEALYALKKLLRIDFEKCFKYKIQQQLWSVLQSKHEVVLEDVQHVLMYEDLFRINYAFQILGVKFLMHSPFVFMEFAGMSEEERVGQFILKFKHPRRFLELLIEGLNTDQIRFYHHEISMDWDSITDSQKIQAATDELKLYIGGHHFFVKTAYLREGMKDSWCCDDVYHR